MILKVFQIQRQSKSEPEKSRHAQRTGERNRERERKIVSTMFLVEIIYFLLLLSKKKEKLLTDRWLKCL